MASSEYEDIVTRTPSAQATIAFLISAFLVSLLPIYLYSCIAALNIQTSLPFIALSIPLSVAGLVFAYANFSYTSQLSLHQQIKQQSSRESATTSTSSKKDEAKETRKRLNSIKSAALAWSICQGNAIYVSLFVLAALGTWGGSVPVDMRLLGTAVIPSWSVGLLSMPVEKQN